MLRMVNLITLVLLLFSVTGLYAQFAGGDGSESNPWQIVTPDQLNLVRDYLGDANSDKHFILISDIDLDVPPYNSEEGWLPLGTAANNFTGHFDGDGFVINNLFINRPDSWYMGLFGVTGLSGQIVNLNIENANISGYSLAGGLAGNNKGIVINCSVSGNISGQNGVGGIAGENNLGTIESCQTHGSITAFGNNGGGLVGRNRNGSTIQNSHSTASVTGSGNNSYGGLVGWNDNLISDCYATGTVTGLIYTGGLVGRNYKGSILRCFATGDVTSSSNSVGGLAGGNAGLDDALISECYATGNVSGDSSVGGLVGENRNHGTISHSYALGSVYGLNNSTTQFGVGGLLGELYIGATVQYSYSTGSVSGNPPLGGLIGYDRGGMTQVSFWNTETSNQNSSAGGQGLITSQMVQENSFYTWDFNDIWQIEELVTYPYLRNNMQDPPPSPYGEPEISYSPDPYDLSAMLGEVLTESLLIENIGEGPLSFELFFDDLIDRRQEWIFFNPDNGVVAPGEIIEIEVTFVTEELQPDLVHNAIIAIENNATDDISIPVSLEVLMPEFPAPINLDIDAETGLFTWEEPEVRNAMTMNRREAGQRLELLEYSVYLDDVLIDSTEDIFYQYEDLVVNQEYIAGVQAVYEYGASEIAVIEFIFKGVDVDFPYATEYMTQLNGNYPNPFNPETTISFSLGKGGRATIKIFDLRGRLIRTLLDSSLEEGKHSVIWDGKCNRGSSVTSGIYFYSLESSGEGESRKMILLK